MKFSAAGGWWGKDWYDKVRLGEKYGFPGVEQLGWLGLDFDLAKKTLDETGVTSTAIVIQSVKKENMEKTAWSHGMVWEDSRNRQGGAALRRQGEQGPGKGGGAGGQGGHHKSGRTTEENGESVRVHIDRLFSVWILSVLLYRSSPAASTVKSWEERILPN